jgi:outer membrane protein OmpA-like peptidoglycan-associated protein
MEEAELGFMDKRNLRIIANNLKQNKRNIDSIVINGFASKPGTRKYNKNLSKKRASNVKEYLISNGVDPSIIEAKGFGESMSLTSKAKSRRVEIYIE